MPIFAKNAAALVATVQSWKEDAFSQKQTTPVPNISYPGDTCCTLYKGANYTYDSITYCNGGPAGYFDLNAHGF